MAVSIIDRLLAAKQAGRTEDVRYRQDQLQKLHASLVEHHSALRDAIRRDADFTLSEAELEVVLTLNAVKDHYECLEFDRSLRAEYLVSQGEDAPDRRVGCGLVYISTVRTFLLFAIVAPLAAAIAAGNVVLVKIENDLRHLPPVMRKCLHALDTETFAITDQRVDDKHFLCQAIVVQQATEDLPDDRKNTILVPSRNVLQGPDSDRVLAVVDRTADIDNAVRTLLRARLSFKAQSNYAPDLVLVNEFVIEEFLMIAKSALAASPGQGEKSDAATNAIGTEQEALLKAVEHDSTAQICAQGAAGCVIRVLSRTSPILHNPIRGPALVVSPTRSLDDSITFSNFIYIASGGKKTKTIATESRFAATYLFAAPAAAKYLSQFISSQVSLINHIPFELLIGPKAPVTPQHSVSIARRYEPSMFQFAQPQYINESASNRLANAVLDSAASGWRAIGSDRTSTASCNGMQQQQLIKAALQPLKPTGQALQTRGIGFFEQGILTGMSLTAMPVLLGLGFIGYSFYTKFI